MKLFVLVFSFSVYLFVVSMLLVLMKLRFWLLVLNMMLLLMVVVLSIRLRFGIRVLVLYSCIRFVFIVLLKCSWKLVLVVWKLLMCSVGWVMMVSLMSFVVVLFWLLFSR